ncbi:hypothetical protein K502DRAFT_324010 [Neoconidiobolus thromboides FSU 785]|nr:hypothetical protein K502DRAFT_324010 [Neoconidiobolus thromboides FSU 785]
MAQMASDTTNIITSVAPQSNQNANSSTTNLLPNRLLLQVRGTEFDLSRDQVINLPESILIVMFPNGVILNSNPEYEALLKQDIKTGLERIHQHIVHVDFNPDMLKYIIDFYQELNKKDGQTTKDLSYLFGLSPGSSSPFTNKKPFITLREELDYFSIPFSPEGKQELCTKTLNEDSLRLVCKEHLMKNTKIFDAFERNIHGGSNLAERQLVDMLCLSGFTRQDSWGYRCSEPNRATLVSISLVPLTSTDEAMKVGVTQKLLLFWRKPARKCWWDIETIKEEDGELEIKLWSRRIWTLELVFV